jgi:hypothetical protein
LSAIFGPSSIPTQEPVEDDPSSVDPGALVGNPDGSLDLSEEALEDLTRQLMDTLRAHDAAMKSRWDREEEIERAYAMIPDSNRGGLVPDAARMVSSITQAFVDQASARISRGIMEVKPLMKVDPIVSAGQEGQIAVDLAKSAEQFYQSYVMDDLDFETLLPIAVKRCVKLGTAVVRAMWKTKRRAFWTGGTRKVKEVGYLDVQMPENHNVVCWPLNVIDAQDAVMFGHRNHLTEGEFLTIAAGLNVPADQVEQILAEHTPDERAKNLLKNQDIKVSRDDVAAHITLTELWCDYALGDETEPTKFCVVLHEDTEQILWVGYNRLRSQKHPYFPIHYQRVDGSFWSKGVGHELLYVHAADSAFRNLEMDNLRATAAWVMLFKAGSMAESLSDRVSPGQRIITESPDEDFATKQLGGDLTMLQEAKQANYQDGVQVTGLASVLMGMGDPAMKSGASATAVVSLIEQAGKKFGDVDATVRDGLEELYIHIMETVAQFAPDGLYYTFLETADAARVRLLRFLPPQGDIARVFKIHAQAPSAAMNKESFKERLLALYQLTTAHINLYMPLAMQTLQQSNPAEIPRLQFQVCQLLQSLYDQVIEAHEVPGVINNAPDVGQQEPWDQILNQAQQQVQMLQGQMQQMQQQLQQAQAQGTAANPTVIQPANPQGNAPQQGPTAPPPPQGQPWPPQVPQQQGMMQ